MSRTAHARRHAHRFVVEKVQRGSKVETWLRCGHVGCHVRLRAEKRAGRKA